MPDAVKRGKAGDPNSQVYFEEGIPEATVNKLRGMLPATWNISAWIT